MQIKPIEHSSLFCLFADEMRREADGRDTILGWYPDGAKIPMQAEDSTVLPRLLVVAVLMTPWQTASADLEFSLILNDNIIHSNMVPLQHFEEANTQASEAPGPLRAGMFRMAIQAQNLVIDQPGYLRVRVVMGELTLHSNSLEFVRPRTP